MVCKKLKKMSNAPILVFTVSEPESRLEDQLSESLYEELKQKQDDQMIGIPCTLDNESRG